MMIDGFEVRPLDEGDEDLIERNVNEYADSKAPAEPRTEDERLVFRASDGEGALAGGCILNIRRWGRAVLSTLWVDEKRRGDGLGSMLIREAERAAREKGCDLLCLGTIDFMARPLYEKHGFELFTLTRDYPRGHEAYSLSKRLDRPAPDYVPTHNGAPALYTIEPGSEEDRKAVGDGLAAYCERFVKDAHDDIDVGRKLVDADGRMIAGVSALVSGWEALELDCVWVDEKYRGRGLASRLLREVEREAKEKGAYMALADCVDWTLGFFGRQGYVPCGTLRDYPRGHDAYELEKRF
ncbi:MAG: GNAT family N-acetyltransferase [Oscillospiraceae bacterium]|nr:GNAT family N-acetyltransferase [Oscillospiraceae bacterium]